MSSSNPTPGGVSLAHYARVSAALEESFPLPLALDAAGLDERAWQRAKVVWRRRLAEDPAELEAYKVELTRAQEDLSRKVAPIDEDPAAWVAFLHAMGASDAPAKWLAKNGLTVNDLARLSRRWDRRVKEDDSIAKRLGELRDKPGPMPALRVGPRASLGDAGSTVKEGDGAAGAPDAPLVLPSAYYQWSSDKGGEAPLPSPRPAETPGLSPLPARPPIPPSLSGTALDLGYDRGPALPFVEGAPVVLPPSSPKAPTWATGTSLSVDVPRGPTLPFAAASRTDGAVAAPSPAASPPAAPPASPLAETSLSLDVPRGPALPFTKDASSKPLPPAPEREVASAKERLGGTSLALDLQIGPVLPFAPPSASPKKRMGFDETSLGFTVPANLPPARSAQRVEAAPAAPATAPPAPAPPAAAPSAPAPPAAAPPAPVALPRISLEQYASLCVELDLYPDRTALTLQRYGVSAAQKDALDHHHRAMFAAVPAMGERWKAACRIYRDWLIKSTRR